ncbi:MAG: glycosyltransferase family 4 protein [Alphaproteobacteria bacterium]|nr:glycosyltransferase family 4 protein [Alphaproteobacteria bacterium]
MAVVLQRSDVPDVTAPARARLPERVVYVHHGQTPGGAPTSLRTLIEGIGEEASEVDRVVGCVFTPMMPFFADVDGISVEQSPPAAVILGKKLIGWNPLFARSSARESICQLMAARHTISEEAAWLEASSPDIVHLNSATLWTTALAAKRADLPLVWHVRETLYGGRFSLRKRLYGRFIRRTADAVIAISPTDAKSLGPDREGKVRVVYNAIDLSRFAPERHDRTEARRRLGLPEDGFLALSLGGFSHRKGAWQLVRALNLLPDRVHLAIVGPGKPGAVGRGRRLGRLTWRIEDALVALGLKPTQTLRYPERVGAEITPGERRLHCPGHADDVAPWIAAADVLVFGGTIPHFARPVYEAWAMAKPVIAFDNQAMRREIEDGVDGFLVPREKPEELADAIHRLADDPELCRRLGEQGRKKALARFDRTKNTRAVLDVYAEVLAARAQQRAA